jgi:hypothetical protein
VLPCRRVHGADHAVQWTYLPIYESSGAVGGVFNPVYDVTARVVSERRMLAMRELGTRLSAARTFTQLLADSCEVLSQLELDLPYAAAYRIQNEEYAGALRFHPAHPMAADALPDPRDAPANTTFILQETIGIPFDAPAAPARVVEGGDAPWDLGLLRGAQNDVVLFDGVQDLLAGLTPRGHAEARPRVAAALPVVEGVELVGCLVVYISGARPVTPALRTFLVLLAREMSTSASVVAAYEDEVQSAYRCSRSQRALTGHQSLRIWPRSTARRRPSSRVRHDAPARRVSDALHVADISHELRTPLTLVSICRA